MRNIRVYHQKKKNIRVCLCCTSALTKKAKKGYYWIWTTFISMQHWRVFYFFYFCPFFWYLEIFTVSNSFPNIMILSAFISQVFITEMWKHFSSNKNFIRWKNRCWYELYTLDLASWETLKYSLYITKAPSVPQFCTRPMAYVICLKKSLCNFDYFLNFDSHFFLF